MFLKFSFKFLIKILLANRIAPNGTPKCHIGAILFVCVRLKGCQKCFLLDRIFVHFFCIHVFVKVLDTVYSFDLYYNIINVSCLCFIAC